MMGMWYQKSVWTIFMLYKKYNMHYKVYQTFNLRKNMFDPKKCCCSDNQYNFDVPWENVWLSDWRFHLKVSKTCYNMLIYWKIKYDSIKKNVYIILKNIPDSRKKNKAPFATTTALYEIWHLFSLAFLIKNLHVQGIIL